MILEKIHSPADLRRLRADEIAPLCGEIRAEILDTVAACGGHLASNLGVVETTVALHRVLHTPQDAIVFDVGHQCYTHKLLTGRREAFSTLRQDGGLSGFPNREESEYDPFTTGHSGASLSAALGIAEANRLRGSDAWTVAVIGDGSFGNGMIYEALNACVKPGLKLMIVLNDNEMSISKNVGALSEHFAKIRLSREYFTFKRMVKDVCGDLPLIGRPLIAGAIHVKEFIKRALNQKNIFESFGLEYLGPLAGEDEPTLETAFREAMACDVPCVVHVVTKKGRGYLPAEEHPELYHGVSPFSLAHGIEPGGKASFSSVFGETMCAIAAEDKRVCAITAAMSDGTGLSPFGAQFPDRLFDVGIAEEHAVTFAAGLARAGMRPVVALYSTFAQRAVDQLLHDTALQKLPLTLALDRAGIVPGDGVTHQGTFDISLFSAIPGVCIYAPESHAELSELLRQSIDSEGITVLRYPRGAEERYDRSIWRRAAADAPIETADFGAGAPKSVIVSYGREITQALIAADALAAAGQSVRVIRLRRIFPLPAEELLAAAAGAEQCVIAEEAMRRGGAGEAICALFGARGVSIRAAVLAVDDFIPHGTVDALRRSLGLDAEGIQRGILGG